MTALNPILPIPYSGGWWRLPHRPRWTELFAGGIQRNPSTGGAKRYPSHGSIRKNIASPSPCCCSKAICSACNANTTPQSWMVTTSGIVYCVGIGASTTATWSGTVNGTWCANNPPTGGGAGCSCAQYVGQLTDSNGNWYGLFLLVSLGNSATDPTKANLVVQLIAQYQQTVFSSVDYRFFYATIDFADRNCTPAPLTLPNALTICDTNHLPGTYGTGGQAVVTSNSTTC